MKIPPKSRRSLRIFAVASFLNDLGSDMIYPIWPLFVTSVLKANMAVLGLIDGLGDAFVSISQAASGYLSDRFRRRKIFVWVGYLMGATSRIGYALAGHWSHLIPFKVLDRTGKIRGAPRDAIIAEEATRDTRGRHFGLLRMMDNLGALCGILLCLALFPILGYRRLFFLAAFPSFLSAALVFFWIHDKRSQFTLFKGFTLRVFHRDYRLFLLLNALFALGTFSYSFLLIFSQKMDYRVTAMPMFYLLFTLTAALFSYPFGRLADRVGRKGVFALSILFWAAVCVLALRMARQTIPFLFVLFGLHKAALEPVQRTWVSELAPAAFRASALGGFQMIVGLCALPASLLAGFLWETLGIRAPFGVSLGLSALALVLLGGVHEARTEGSSAVHEGESFG